MENESQKADKIYLKPNTFDIVLEVIAGVLLFFLWGIALGPFVFPESYANRFDQSHVIIVAIAFSLIMVLYYRTVRFPYPIKRNGFVKITEGNAERQYRLGARSLRILAIVLLASIAGSCTRGVIPLKIIHTLWEASLSYTIYFLACFLIWFFVRSWMLR